MKIYVPVSFEDEKPISIDVVCIGKTGAFFIGTPYLDKDGTVTCSGYGESMFDVKFWLKEIEVPENTTVEHLKNSVELMDTVEFCQSVIKNQGLYDLSERIAFNKCQEVISKVEQNESLLLVPDGNTGNDSGLKVDDREFPCDECDDGELKPVGFVQPNGCQKYECDSCGHETSFP